MAAALRPRNSPAQIFPLCLRSFAALQSVRKVLFIHVVGSRGQGQGQVLSAPSQNLATVPARGRGLTCDCAVHAGAQVLDDELCYKYSEYCNIYEVYATRARMFRNVYLHR